MAMKQGTSLNYKTFNAAVDGSIKADKNRINRGSATSAKISLVATNKTGAYAPFGIVGRLDGGSNNGEFPIGEIGAIGNEVNDEPFICVTAISTENDDNTGVITDGPCYALVKIIDPAHKYLKLEVGSHYFITCEFPTRTQLIFESDTTVVFDGQNLKQCLVRLNAPSSEPLVYQATSDEVAGEITGKPMKLDLTVVGDDRTFKVFP